MTAQGSSPRIEESHRKYKRAMKILVGGVNSPVRSFMSVGGEPLIVRRGEGPYIYDADGNEYVDLICGWGSLILGHARREVLLAVQEALERGSILGLTNELEIELAERIAEAFPSIELVRFVNSGTEAAMTAIRLARAYTGRRKVLKFDGCYHGHVDYLLTKAGSGLATYSLPASDGIPEEITKDTITVPYNDTSVVERVFRQAGPEIACVIVEPIAGNMGVVPPKQGFLEALRDITEKYGSLLIFDEVITGFRITRGGVQELYSVHPDLTCLGKIIGGGFPIGAVGGREEIMKLLAPTGRVYQAGTFSGNPISMSAGIATIDLLTPHVYEKLERLSSMLERGIVEAANNSNVTMLINRVGSMISLFFTDRQKIENYSDVLSSNRGSFTRLFWEMARRGVLLPPSPFETIFVSASHEEAVIERSIEAFTEALRVIGEGRE
ncbi:MAG: glutamate-1-semialdehyde 2,1-aminomutase [Nitrososphaerota archaeon]